VEAQPVQGRSGRVVGSTIGRLLVVVQHVRAATTSHDIRGGVPGGDDSRGYETGDRRGFRFIPVGTPRENARPARARRLREERSTRGPVPPRPRVRLVGPQESAKPVDRCRPTPISCSPSLAPTDTCARSPGSAGRHSLLARGAIEYWAFGFLHEQGVIPEEQCTLCLPRLSRVFSNQLRFEDHPLVPARTTGVRAAQIQSSSEWFGLLLSSILDSRN